MTIPEILSHYSALGYSAGDVLSTGTVSGVAGFSPDAASLYLKPGDVMECEIERDRHPPEPGRLVGGGARRARASSRAVVRRDGADLNILVGAVGLSALGDWLALVPLTLHLQEATGSGITIALLYIAFWAPSVVLAGPAGLLADRYDPRRVLLLVSTAQATVAVALAFAGGTALILGLAALLGIGFAVAQPAEFALVPRVAGEARLALANGGWRRLATPGSRSARSSEGCSRRPAASRSR